MSPGHVSLDWAGEVLTLLPERAIWWARGETVFIADPHFGKAATFRLAGIPVPENSHDEDLKRLSNLLAATKARRLMILGDFFHAKTGRTAATLATLEEWRKFHRRLEIILVRGNHDRKSGDVPAAWDFESVDGPWMLGPFCCRHEPRADRGAFVLAGHLHPSHALPDRIGLSLRGPCFYFGKRIAVLPAFGSFTGTHRIDAEANARIFLIGPDLVMEAPCPRVRRN